MLKENEYCKKRYERAKAVLILILMEHAQRANRETVRTIELCRKS